jgi:hypothetical protein
LAVNKYIPLVVLLKCVQIQDTSSTFIVLNNFLFHYIVVVFMFQFTQADAGYTATDYVLSQLAMNTECTYLSVTNGDNVYGSEVVERVIDQSYKKGRGKGSQSAPMDIILSPLDSRNFAQQGKMV